MVARAARPTHETVREYGGPLIDASAHHLLVSDDTCTGNDLRAIPVALAPTARPAGPRTCPFAVRARRTVRAGKVLPVRVRCKLGCRLQYEWRYYSETRDSVHGQDGETVICRGKARTLKFEAHTKGDTRAPAAAR
ncbi:MAG: hypothetical protein LC685_01760 [Actinobacteria bacterium]|nr:hypothetical protein [Actinomycetota bacterium]